MSMLKKRDTISDMTMKIIDELWSLYLTNEFSSLIENAISASALINPNQLIHELIINLSSKDNNVGWYAARVLSKIKSEYAIEPLIEILKNDKVENSFIRWCAVIVIGNIGSKEAIGPLRKALEDSDFDVRNRAFDSLEKINRKTGFIIR